MESIFHEKQEGSLCAQHCLNALLQNHYFSAVDLAQIASRLDERERERMAEGGVGTNEYQQFIEQPSSNYDDSGFFSIQVITEALSVWGLDVVLYNSSNEVAVQARQNPRQMSAFICNYLQHWFSVRKLGQQWFNLNSLLSGPELISDTYLSLFLTQLQQEGYSIFIVMGSLPECDADMILKTTPAVQTVKPKLLSEVAKGSGQDGEAVREVEGEEEEDFAFKEALRVSREMIDNDDSSLQTALQMSMEGYFHNQGSQPVHIPRLSAGEFGQGSSSQASNTAPVLSQEELRKKRLAALSHTTTDQPPSSEVDKTANAADTGQSQELSEEELLQQAIAMSMQQDS